MRHRRQLESLAKALRSEGIVIPPFDVDALTDTYYFHSRSGLEPSRHLSFTTGIDIFVDVHSPDGDDMPLERVMANKGRVDFVGTHLSGPIWNRYIRSDEIDSETAKSIVSQYNENLQTQRMLDDHLGGFSQGCHVSDRQTKELLSEDRLRYVSYQDVYEQQIARGNLRVFDTIGKPFPYVLCSTDQIYGSVGRSVSGLFFVAREHADEPWKEMLIAYHEKFCQRHGHMHALRKEDALASKLGLGERYYAWRNCHITQPTHEQDYMQ